MTLLEKKLDSADKALLEETAEVSRRLKDEIGKVIIGQESTVRPILAAVLAQGHALVIGVPGLAKTLLIKTLAQALGWSFKRIQFTPDMMPSDITGMELLFEDPETGRTMKFVPGPIFAHIILADEINRTPPKTQAALLEAMQEHTVTSMGKAYPLEKPFIVFATQNPIEQEGTYPLPEAQLDRFMMSLWMTYPTAQEEEDIVMATTEDLEPQVSTVCPIEKVRGFQHLVRRIPVSRHVVKYAVALARGTRPEDSLASDYVRQYVSWGAGPRAGQHMILIAKAFAAMEGQSTVSSEHVRQSAPLVLRHRVLPNYNASGEGIKSADIVSQVIAEMAEPMYSE